MTIKQKYIFLIIILTGFIIGLNNKDLTHELPDSVGEPLELIIIKDVKQANKVFYKKLKENLIVDIGPAPQPESTLKLIEIDKQAFKGIFKRHKNLLIVSLADEFSVRKKNDLFAKNQTVFFVDFSPLNTPKEWKQEILRIVEDIRGTEMKRLARGFEKTYNKEAQKEIQKKHGFSMRLPKEFFLAYSDPATTWKRRELPKSSQGILIANLPLSTQPYSAKYILSKADSIIQSHIFGPTENTYMAIEKQAPILIDTVLIHNQQALKIQSLWRMENDFMGGVFNLYYFTTSNKKNPKIIYTYLYAPGEKKSIFLIQLEAIINTISFNY